MIRKPQAFPGLLFLFACFFSLSHSTQAQTGATPQAVATPSRIALPVDDSSLVTLKGNTHPLARAEFDQGAVTPSLPLHRMLLVLKRSAEQDAALSALLDDQQNATSANYHKWLTPEQFGAQFGPAPQDEQIISAWLQGHGFQVTGVSRGGNLIEFSGAASSVQDAFHTPMHMYAVEGKTYYANSQDPQIPTALGAVVAGVRSLHNFPARPLNHAAGVFHRDKDTGQVLPVGKLPIPQFSFGEGCGILGGPCELLGPTDFATIYNVAPLWAQSSPIDGTGQTIAISGETDINPADWTAFWSVFGVSPPKGKLNIIVNGPDPGFQGDESEADIDTQWSSAVAKGATIDYVESETTETTLGVDLSAEYIVDNNLAAVMSESYGICELYIGTSGNTFYNTLWQQAAAQGITVFISSGDQGSSVCDGGEPFAENGLAVNGFGSTPYNVAVGGTDFNDLATTATYWSAANNQTTGGNAKGYIPEMTWNDTCTNAEIFKYLTPATTTAEQTCNDVQAQDDMFLGVAGGSGGASNCTVSTTISPTSCSGGYAKPSWQVGVAGIPSDGKRDVPDVSLFASNGFNNTSYIICEADQAGTCNLQGGDFLGFGGTSVSSPAFAGIMALVNQKTGERQGNANYVFYKMAATAANVCNSNSVASTGTNSCIFYDTPAGSTIAMACATDSLNCTTSNNSDTYGVLSGFATGAGYDQATGLGSVNVTNLVNQWSTYSGKFTASKFTAFTLGPPATITHGQAIAVAATVAPASGSGTPTGSVVLEANNGASASGEQSADQVLTLSNASLPAGTTTEFLPGGTSYAVTAHYSGDGTFAPADSTPVTVTVNPESSKATTSIVTFDPNTGQLLNANATSLAFGAGNYLLRTNVTNSSANPCAVNGVPKYGCPTGTLTIKDTYNGATNAVDGGTFSLNTEGYGEDQAIFLTGGQHSIAASYGGDKSFNASAAPVDAVTVTKAASTLTLDQSYPIFPTTSPLIFTGTLSGNAFLPSNPPTAYFPSGNVQFFDGATPITGTLSDSPTVYYNGAAMVDVYISVPSLTAGNHTITAQYAGDSNYAQSPVSNAYAIDVIIPTTVKETTSSATFAHGTSVTLTAKISQQTPGGPGITGTMNFFQNCNNCTSLGTAPILNGQAQLVTSTLPAGNYTVLASYPGNSYYGNSGDAVNENVTLLASTTTASTSNGAISAGTSVTLSATVKVASGGPAPTGTIQFASTPQQGLNGTSVGSPVTLASGQAMLTTTAIPGGTQFVNAFYSGDTNYSASSASVAEVVTAAATFTMAASPATVTVNAPGGSASAVVTLTGQSGYSGTVQLTSASCAGLPSETTCSFNPSTLTLSSTAQTAMTTVTFQTTAASNAVPTNDGPSGVNLSSPHRTVWTMGFVVVTALGFLFVGFATPRRRGVVLATLTVAAVMAFASCGGGGSGGGGGTHNPGTPQGSYPITMTASSNVMPAPTTTVTLNVN